MSDTTAAHDAATPPARRFWRTEDWTAVWLGAIVIATALLGLPSAAPTFRWGSLTDLTAKVLAASNLGSLGLISVAILILATVGIGLVGGSARKFVAGFCLVYLLSTVSLLIAGNAGVHAWGLEYVLFALVLGLIVSNGVGVPEWAREAVRTEFYIKTGLVVLGATIFFGDILRAGLFGIVQALVVVSCVWFFSFWLGRKLGVDDEFNAMLSSAVAICGVSAAIAACGAIQGDQRKLSYVTSLVLIVAVPMMVGMPWIIQAAAIPEMVGGAWLGGTLDTSGSVVAAGSLISESAMQTGVIVKLSQNVLIGVAAMLLSIWWSIKKEGAQPERPRIAVIWERFPKFVLGFLAASLLFSLAIDPAVAKATKPVLEGFRNAWFAMAFVCIGLETRLPSLLKMGDGRPALTFLGAQTFNVIWALLVAYLLFGGILFSVPQLTAQ